ncbi:MAG: hypothetical protein DCC65_01135 [Planctomycetota bacterium]|nr:MAG: hypothetical protein DCC65_01135 [Planctomycetota bacterium]
MSAPFEPLLVTQPADLQRLCKELRRAGSFAFDTEFVGEETYKPDICLLQVATDELHALVDPIAGLDTKPLWQMIADPKIEKILHAGTEDLALAWRHFGLKPANIVDLQIAAGFVGFGHPISLGRLATVTLHTKLHKSQTLTDWRRRPLQGEQLRYAVEDVVHLPAMWREIRTRIEKLGRAEWLSEECLALCETATRNSTDEKRIRRLRGTASMTRKQLAIVHAVLVQRDELARRLNRPPRTVLKDHLVVELARHGWTDPEKIRTLRGINLAAADLKRLARAIADAKAASPDSWPAQEPSEPAPDEEVLLSLLTAILRAWCDDHDLAYSLLATKQDLRNLLRGDNPDPPGVPRSALTQGWRAAAVGDLLDRVLHGKASIRIASRGDSRRLVVE